MADRRPSHFWSAFNTWHRAFTDSEDRRPTTKEITLWFEENAELVWPDATNRPTLTEAKNHAKGMRTIAKVRAYFRDYRAHRKLSRNSDLYPRRGKRLCDRVPGADGEGDAANQDTPRRAHSAGTNGCTSGGSEDVDSEDWHDDGEADGRQGEDVDVMASPPPSSTAQWGSGRSARHSHRQQEQAADGVASRGAHAPRMRDDSHQHGTPLQPLRATGPMHGQPAAAGNSGGVSGLPSGVTVSAAALQAAGVPLGPFGRAKGVPIELLSQARALSAASTLFPAAEGQQLLQSAGLSPGVFANGLLASHLANGIQQHLSMRRLQLSAVADAAKARPASAPGRGVQDGGDERPLSSRRRVAFLDGTLRPSHKAAAATAADRNGAAREPDVPADEDERGGGRAKAGPVATRPGRVPQAHPSTSYGAAVDMSPGDKRQRGLCSRLVWAREDDDDEGERQAGGRDGARHAAGDRGAPDHDFSLGDVGADRGMDTATPIAASRGPQHQHRRLDAWAEPPGTPRRTQELEGEAEQQLVFPPSGRIRSPCTGRRRQAPPPIMPGDSTGVEAPPSMPDYPIGAGDQPSMPDGANGMAAPPSVPGDLTGAEEPQPMTSGLPRTVVGPYMPGSFRLDNIPVSARASSSRRPGRTKPAAGTSAAWSHLPAGNDGELAGDQPGKRRRLAPTGDAHGANGAAARGDPVGMSVVKPEPEDDHAGTGALGAEPRQREPSSVGLRQREANGGGARQSEKHDGDANQGGACAAADAGNNHGDGTRDGSVPGQPPVTEPAVEAAPPATAPTLAAAGRGTGAPGPPRRQWEAATARGNDIAPVLIDARAPGATRDPRRRPTAGCGAAGKLAGNNPGALSRERRHAGHGADWQGHYGVPPDSPKQGADGYANAEQTGMEDEQADVEDERTWREEEHRAGIEDERARAEAEQALMEEEQGRIGRQKARVDGTRADREQYDDDDDDEDDYNGRRQGRGHARLHDPDAEDYAERGPGSNATQLTRRPAAGRKPTSRSKSMSVLYGGGLGPGLPAADASIAQTAGLAGLGALYGLGSGLQAQLPLQQMGSSILPHSAQLSAATDQLHRALQLSSLLQGPLAGSVVGTGFPLGASLQQQALASGLSSATGALGMYGALGALGSPGGGSIGSLLGTLGAPWLRPGAPGLNR